MGGVWLGELRAHSWQPSELGKASGTGQRASERTKEVSCQFSVASERSVREEELWSPMSGNARRPANSQFVADGVSLCAFALLSKRIPSCPPLLMQSSQSQSILSCRLLAPVAKKAHQKSRVHTGRSQGASRRTRTTGPSLPDSRSSWLQLGAQSKASASSSCKVAPVATSWLVGERANREAS